MKKFLAGIISIAMCAAMFTACGSGADTETAESSAVTTISETAAESTAAETTETKTELANKYDSIGDFVVSDPFKLETETVEGSLFSDYMEKNLNGEGVYFNMETPDGRMKMLLAFDKNNMCLKAEGAGENMYVYTIDGIMYILDPEEKIGFSMTMDQDTAESMKSEALAGIDLDSAAAQVDKSQCVDVEIDGEVYTFENLEKIGALFHKNGDIYAVLNGGDEALQVLLVNEMSSNVPEGIFELPKDYEIIDMEELFAGLEDYDVEGSDEPVKTEFDSMEDFNGAFLWEYTGEEYSIDETLSAEIIDIMYNSDQYYFEVADFFNEEIYIKAAVSEDRAMVNGESMGIDDATKLIYDDNKAYRIIDKEKKVIVTSPEGLPTVEEYTELFPLEMGEGSKFYITEITIAGKKYFLETQKDNYFNCMLYNEDKTLYAAVFNGYLRKFNLTEDIPEGTFDIPSDYEVIDADDME